MLKKAFIGVLFVALLSTIMMAGTDSDVTKAVNYGSSGTTVGGIISQNTTWMLENSPFVFVDDVMVAAGVTLTIEPGVTADLDFWALRVDGALHAVGNETHGITFQTRERPLTSNVRIYFTESSTPWNEDTKTGCIIEYAEIDLYCGGGYGIRGGSPKISRNLMHFSGCDAGIIATSVGIISNNTILTDGYRAIVTEGDASVLFNIIIGGEQSPAVGIGVGGDSPTVIGNLITDCYGWSTGDMTGYAGIVFYGGRPYVANNTLLNCSEAFGFPPHFDASGLNQTIIAYNNIYGDSYAVVVGKANPRITINLFYNWWGTTNASLIDQKIYDQKDDRSLCLINYTAFLTSPAYFPLDVTPPNVLNITQEPRERVEPFENVTIRTNVTDDITGVNEVIFSYTISDGLTWSNLTMSYNSTRGLYETTIPGHPFNTTVKYKVATYDYVGNYKDDDNGGQYYVYTVIPEFPSTIILPLFALTTLIVTILLKKKRKTKPQLP
jgi:hypothetical protein